MQRRAHDKVISSANCPHKLSLDSLFRVSFSFLRREGAQNEVVWIIGGGGGLVCICVINMWQTRGGPGACSPDFDLLDRIYDCFHTNITYHLLSLKLL